MTEISGRLPVNTDGGCLANGEPVGASGLRQVYECVLQLRGQAGSRQVENDYRISANFRLANTSTMRPTSRSIPVARR